MGGPNVLVYQAQLSNIFMVIIAGAQSGTAGQNYCQSPNGKNLDKHIAYKQKLPQYAIFSLIVFLENV